MLVLAGLWALLGCTSSELTPVDDFETTNAKLINNIAVDGCEWHLTVDLKDEIAQFLPNDASQSKVDAIIKQVKSQNGLYNIEVKMTYRLTNKKKTVRCGWGKDGSFDEIDIADIQVK